MYNLPFKIYLIIDGITIYDGLSKENFLLRGHMIMWTGDIPAITKIMCLTGHNSYMGCRFCYLRGVYCSNRRHVYYPCDDPFNLNRRTQQNFEYDILLVENENQQNQQKEIIKSTGMNCIFFIFLYFFLKIIIFN